MCRIKNRFSLFLVSSLLFLSACAAGSPAESDFVHTQDESSQNSTASEEERSEPLKPTEASAESEEPSMTGKIEGPLEPEVWEEKINWQINTGRSIGNAIYYDDLYHALDEYADYFAGMYCLKDDFSKYTHLSFSETVLSDARRTLQYRKEMQELWQSRFTYAKALLRIERIEIEGYYQETILRRPERIVIDANVLVYFQHVWLSSPEKVNGYTGMGTDHRLVLEIVGDGTYLLVSDSFDERTNHDPNEPGAYSSD